MHRLSAILIASFTLMLAACGGSGGSAPQPIASSPPPAPTPTEGTAIIGLTDAAGDFLSYQVTVAAISLQRADGVVIETLPESTTIDFAQYVEATEFVTAAAVPTGAYTGITLSLDYTDAQILVEDADGNAAAAVVVDAAGTPIMQTQLEVVLADADRFVIAPGVPSHITLDFDLATSHDVNLNAQPFTATLGGVLLADTLLEDAKPHRARGLLRRVDTDAAVFTMDIRPFYHPRGNFGALRVMTGDQTQFEIDQQDYLGADGLAALAAKDPTTAVVAWGDLAPGTRDFKATRVLAGSSVPFGSADIAKGTIIARDGDRLTLRGATLIRADMSVVFNNTLEVTVGPATRIHQQGASLLPLTVAEVSVGQRITALGQLRDAQTLDASDGLLRVLYTTVGGIAVEVAPLTLDLVAINGRRTGLFDFTGTGIDNANDAQPESYDVDTGSLPLSGIDIGTPLKVRGLVAPFGSAPADFVAKTLGDLSPLPAGLRVRWTPPGAADAVLAIDAQAIVLALNEDALSPVHHIVQAGVPQDLLATGDTLTLRPRDSGRGVFALRFERRQYVYFDFARFSAALAERLGGNTAITFIRARGDVVGSNDFEARSLLITLQ